MALQSMFPFSKNFFTLQYVRALVGVFVASAFASYIYFGSTLPSYDSLSSPGQVISTIDRGGLVLKSARVHLIFWGSSWNQGTSPTKADVITSVQKILDSSYTSALIQYRGIGPSHLVSSILVDSYEPPNPFNSGGVENFLKTRFVTQNFSLPSSSDDLYVVIMPPTVHSMHSSGLGSHGTLEYFSLAPLRWPLVRAIHYAWVTDDGTLDGITYTFAHELVESLTDPEFDALGLRTIFGGIGEIADACTSRPHFLISGISVPQYWSAKDRSCIGPSLSPHFNMESFCGVGQKSHLLQGLWVPCPSPAIPRRVGNALNF